MHQVLARHKQIFPNTGKPIKLLNSYETSCTQTIQTIVNLVALE